MHTDSPTHRISRALAPLLTVALLLCLGGVAHAQTAMAETDATPEVGDAETSEDEVAGEEADTEESDEELPQKADETSEADEATSDEGAASDIAEGDAATEDASTAARRSDEEEFFGEAHRRQMYEQTRKRPTRALLYTLALPGLGNVYAEQYFLAGLAFSLMAFTTMFVAYGLSTQQPQFLHMGLVTGGVAYSGGAVSSYFGVRKYNKRLREGFNLDKRASLPTTPYELPRARTVNVSIRF